MNPNGEDPRDTGFYPSSNAGAADLVERVISVEVSALQALSEAVTGATVLAEGAKLLETAGGMLLTLMSSVEAKMEQLEGKNPTGRRPTKPVGINRLEKPFLNGEGDMTEEEDFDLMALLFGEGGNPLEGMFASTYEKYLNGNGEDIPGLIPTSEKALQDIKLA